MHLPGVQCVRRTMKERRLDRTLAFPVASLSPSVCISSIDPSSLLILQRGNTAGSRATASLAHVKCLTDDNLLVLAEVVCRDFEVELQ
jgi:hypothetical protein